MNAYSAIHSVMVYATHGGTILLQKLFISVYVSRVPFTGALLSRLLHMFNTVGALLEILGGLPQVQASSVVECYGCYADRQELGKEVALASKQGRRGRAKEKDCQENTPPVQVSSVDRSVAGRHHRPGDIGWRYNQTFVKVTSLLDSDP